MLRSRDLPLVRYASRLTRLPSPLFGILVVALMALTGASPWHQQMVPAALPLLAQASSGARPALYTGPASGPAYVSVSITGDPAQAPNVGDAFAAEDAIAPALVAASSAPNNATTAREPALASAMAAPISEPTAIPASGLIAKAELKAAVAPETNSKPSRELRRLAAASSAPDRVTSPAIGLDQPVITVGWHQETINEKLVSVWDVAQYAVGWHKNTKLPGQGGNIVLAGHNNIYGEVFKNLDQLKPGDIITVHADGRDYDYAVESTVIVKEEGATPAEKVANARWIGFYPDERLTLVACYPYTGNSHRILIIARPLFQVA